MRIDRLLLLLIFYLIFPQQVNIKSVADRKNIVIDLEYNRVVLNGGVEMPYSVPKRFTLMD